MLFDIFFYYLLVYTLRLAGSLEYDSEFEF